MPHARLIKFMDQKESGRLFKNDTYGIEPITALLHGGEQEMGFRAGTLAVHDIVGFGKAAEIAARDMDKNEVLLRSMDERLVGKLLNIPDISLTNPSKKRVPGIVSILVDKRNFHNERFIKKVSDDLAISTGSACSAGEPSYVIASLGKADKVSKVLRISINKFTTEEDIDQLVQIFADHL